MQCEFTVLCNTAEFVCVVEMIHEGNQMLKSLCLAIEVYIRTHWQIQEKEELEKLLLVWLHLEMGLMWRHSQINSRFFTAE